MIAVYLLRTFMINVFFIFVGKEYFLSKTGPHELEPTPFIKRSILIYVLSLDSLSS